MHTNNPNSLRTALTIHPHFFISRLPAGYCFVDFQDAESALRAQLRLNGKIIPNSEPVSTMFLILLSLPNVVNSPSS